MRLHQNKSKREELNEMTRLRTLESVTRKERRRDLQSQILINLRKSAKDMKFVNQWYKAFIVYQVA